VCVCVVQIVVCVSLCARCLEFDLELGLVGGFHRLLDAQVSHDLQTPRRHGVRLGLTVQALHALAQPAAGVTGTPKDLRGQCGVVCGVV
jgi:hypothetical protein